MGRWDLNASSIVALRAYGSCRSIEVPQSFTGADEADPAKIFRVIWGLVVSGCAGVSFSWRSVTNTRCCHFISCIDEPPYLKASSGQRFLHQKLNSLPLPIIAPRSLAQRKADYCKGC